MRTQSFWTAGALLATFAIGMTALPAFARQEKEQEEKTEGKAWPPSVPTARISPIQAMAAAKKKVGGGTAFQANFEFDEGHWVYGVMVVKGHRLSEVEVDPASGRALSSEMVTAADEAKESTEMLKKIAAAGG